MIRDGALHELLISILVAHLRPRIYLELGVGYGETLYKVMAMRYPSTRTIQVDVSGDVPQLADECYTEQTSRWLSRYGGPPIDMAFIDADHSKESVEGDFKLLWPLMDNEGLVFLHDGNPEKVGDTHKDLCGDGWKAIKRITEHHEAVTLPYHPGLTIVRRRASWGPGE